MEQKFCSKCGTIVMEGQKFCAKCGGQVNVQLSRTCSACGAELDADQVFCDKCGQKNDVAAAPVANPVVAPTANPTVAPAANPAVSSVATPVVAVPAANSAIENYNMGVEKKKKKPKALPIVLAIVIAFAGIAGFFGYSAIQENKRQEAIAQYKANAATFYEQVLSSGVKMEKIGNAIQTAWGKYVYNSRYGAYYNGQYLYSVDSAVDAAQDEQADNISAVQSNDSYIRSLYQSLLVVPDTSESELLMIRDAVEEAYDAYQEMYGVVIEVSGNYTSFKADFAETDTDLSVAVKDLGELVNY